MFKTDHMIDLVRKVGIVFVQKAIFASVPGTDCDACAKVISDVRAQAGVSCARGI